MMKISILRNLAAAFRRYWPRWAYEAIRTEMEKCCGDNSSELIVAHQLFSDAERFAGVRAVQATKRNGR